MGGPVPSPSETAIASCPRRARSNPVRLSLDATLRGGDHPATHIRSGLMRRIAPPTDHHSRSTAAQCAPDVLGYSRRAHASRCAHIGASARALPALRIGLVRRR